MFEPLIQLIQYPFENSPGANILKFAYNKHTLYSFIIFIFLYILSASTNDFNELKAETETKIEFIFTNPYNTFFRVKLYPPCLNLEYNSHKFNLNDFCLRSFRHVAKLVEHLELKPQDKNNSLFSATRKLVYDHFFNFCSLNLDEIFKNENITLIQECLIEFVIFHEKNYGSTFYSDFYKKYSIFDKTDISLFINKLTKMSEIIMINLNNYHEFIYFLNYYLIEKVYDNDIELICCLDLKMIKYFIYSIIISFKGTYDSSDFIELIKEEYEYILGKKHCFPYEIVKRFIMHNFNEFFYFVIKLNIGYINKLIRKKTISKKLSWKSKKLILVANNIKPKKKEIREDYFEKQNNWYYEKKN